MTVVGVALLILVVELQVPAVRGVDLDAADRARFAGWIEDGHKVWRPLGDGRAVVRFKLRKRFLVGYRPPLVAVPAIDEPFPLPSLSGGFEREPGEFWSSPHVFTLPATPQRIHFFARHTGILAPTIVSDLGWIDTSQSIK